LSEIVFAQALYKQNDGLKKLFADIHQQKAAHALDDTADILIRCIQKFHNMADEALQNFRTSQTTQVEKLITQLKAIATAYTQGETAEQRLNAIDTLLAGNSEQLIADCDAQLAFADNNYFPFLLKPYKNKHSSLLDCLTLLPLASTTTDLNLERAIAFIKQHRWGHAGMHVKIGHKKKVNVLLPCRT
jgi:hypothetical protein